MPKSDPWLGHKTKTCAVVGNSGTLVVSFAFFFAFTFFFFFFFFFLQLGNVSSSLTGDFKKGLELGSLIDSCDHVYRVNFPPVYTEFKKDIGTRTTHMFLSQRTSEMASSATSTLFDRFKSAAIVMQAQTLQQYHAFKTLRHSDHNVFVLGHELGFLAWNITNRLVKSVEKRQMPSTGLIALLAAMVNCETVHAIGFGDVPQLGKYWDSVGDIAKQVNRQKQVEYVLEEFWIRTATLGELYGVDAHYERLYNANKQLSLKMHTNTRQPPICWKDYVDEKALVGSTQTWNVFLANCGAPASDGLANAPTAAASTEPTTTVLPTLTSYFLTAPVNTGAWHTLSPTPVGQGEYDPDPPTTTHHKFHSVPLEDHLGNAPPVDVPHGDAPEVTDAPPALSFAQALPLSPSAAKKPLTSVGNVNNEWPECAASNASALQLMAQTQCDSSASLCIEHAGVLENLCACYESWSYCYKSAKCGWTPLIGCANLVQQRHPCQPYNCWTGKQLNKDGEDRNEGFVALGGGVGLGGEGGLNGSSGWSAGAQLQMISFMLVFMGLGMLGVRAMRQRGIITDTWRVDSARLRSQWRELFPNVNVNSAVSAVRATVPSMTVRPPRPGHRGGAPVDDAEESKA
jgi:hypothetical protein